MDRGAEVTVIVFRGERRRRRVWEDLGPGVLICTEEEYRRAVETGEEPMYVGFPREDVIGAGADADDEEG